VTPSLRFVTDEDFDNDILRGLMHRCPELDIVRAQDVGLAGKKDPVVLLTHDVNTLIAYAYARAGAGLAMPGVFAVRQFAPIGQAIEDILLLALLSLDGEWEGQIRYLPLP
jgi:hypothetical protein